MAQPPGSETSGLALARQQHAQHQHRGAHLAHQVIGRRGRGDLAGTQGQFAASSDRPRLSVLQGQLDPVLGQQAAQRGDVGQLRQVGQGQGVVGQQGRGHQRQGGVLRPADVDLALERAPAAYPDPVHQLPFDPWPKALGMAPAGRRRRRVLDQGQLALNPPASSTPSVARPADCRRRRAGPRPEPRHGLWPVPCGGEGSRAARPPGARAGPPSRPLVCRSCRAPSGQAAGGGVAGSRRHDEKAWGRQPGRLAFLGYRWQCPAAFGGRLDPVRARCCRSSGVEHVLGKDGVGGSIPLGSTSAPPRAPRRTSRTSSRWPHACPTCILLPPAAARGPGMVARGFMASLALAVGLFGGALGALAAEEPQRGQAEEPAAGRRLPPQLWRLPGSRRQRLRLRRRGRQRASLYRAGEGHRARRLPARYRWRWLGLRVGRGSLATRRFAGRRCRQRCSPRRAVRRCR
jgi:hypothetical protein